MCTLVVVLVPIKGCKVQCINLYSPMGEMAYSSVCRDGYRF